jgi:predicted regulator of Ras-like GTPase activity (Roadblock/LC7/MglB family)
MKMEPELQEILKNLKRNVPPIQSALVVNSQGIFLASIIDEGIDREAISTMSAAISALGESVLGELKGGKLEEVLIRGSERLILIRSVLDDAFLFIITKEDTPLGLLKNEVQRAQTAIREIDRPLFLPKNPSQFLKSREEEELTKFIEKFAVDEKPEEPEEREEAS